jgi:hypothetical protein
MLKILTSFTVLLTLSVAFFAENDAQSVMSSDHREVVISSHSANDISVTIYSELFDVKDDHCHDQDSHCENHCIGLHNLFLTEHKITLFNQFQSEGKTSWYYKSHYLSLFFEPALKPPLFS